MTPLLRYVMIMLCLLCSGNAAAQPSNTLIYAEPYLPETVIDPTDPRTTQDAVKRRLISLVFDPLVDGIDVKGRPFPILIGDTVKTVQSGRQYTVTLRDDVFWHNNAPLTAEDVKFTYDLIRQYHIYPDPFLARLNVEIKGMP